MVDDPESPDDISSMMEDLWGPRDEGPVDNVRPAPRPPDGPQEQVQSPRGAGNQRGDSMSGLTEMVEARHAESIERARADLEGLRSHFDVVLGQIAEQLDEAREDAVAAADARVAGAEARLLGRLDDIAARVTQTTQGSAAGSEVVARLDVVEREASERSAALEQRVATELQRLAEAFEELKAGRVTTGAPLAAPGTTEGAAPHAASVDAALTRLDSLEQRLAEGTASSEPSAADITALRTELQADLARMLQAERAELDRVLDGRIGETEAKLATLSVGELQLTGAQDDLNRALEDLAAKVSRSADSEEAEALRARLDVVERQAFQPGAAQDPSAETELQRLAEAVEDLREQSVTPADLDSVRTEVGARVEAELALRLQEQRNELEEAIVGRIKDTQDELATLGAGAQQLARAQEELNQALASLAENLSRSGDTEAETGDAVERQIAEAVGLLAQRVAVRQSEVQAALEARVAQLQVALDREAARVGAAVDRAERAGTEVARISGGNGDLARAQEDLSRRFDEMAERLQRLQAVVDTEAARVGAVVKSQPTGPQAAARKGSAAKGQAAMTRPEGGDADRLQALEEHARETDDEMSDLNELHAALDMGLGTLRSEIAELRDSMKKMAGDQADLFDRLETTTPVPPAGGAEKSRPRKPGRKG